MSVLNELKEIVVKGDITKAKETTHDCLSQGLKPGQLISDALIPAMDAVGEKYKNGEIFVPEMLIAAKAMQGCLEILKPLLTAGEVKSSGKVVIGTVKGDLHDIGKNLVIMMLEGAGFEVYDLGTDVPAEQFVSKIEELKPDLLGMSGLLTTTIDQMGVTIEALKQAGLRDKVKVMVGGAPVTPEFAEKIGADAYAPDAAGAVDWAKQAMAEKSA